MSDCANKKTLVKKFTFSQIFARFRSVAAGLAFTPRLSVPAMGE
jgi:hypothetical protein